MNKIDKCLARLRKRKLKGIKLENERGDITTDKTEIHSIIRDYYLQLHPNKSDYLEETDTFLQIHNIPRLNRQEMENQNRPMASKKTESVIKTSQQRKPQDEMASLANYAKCLKKN